MEKGSMNIQEAAQFMGVPLSITKDELKSKYRDLVKQYHPDVSNHYNSHELIQKLNASYDILKDKVPIQERQYQFPQGRTGIFRCCQYRQSHPCPGNQDRGVRVWP